MADGVTVGGASAVLAASIFHFGDYTIEECKKLSRSRYFGQGGLNAVDDTG
ncbi:hypothetical protein OURE66S_04406 [Oligella ureolytica]